MQTTNTATQPVTKFNFLDLTREEQCAYTAQKLAQGYGERFTSIHEEVQADITKQVAWAIENMVTYPELDADAELSTALMVAVGYYKLARITARLIVEDLKLDEL